MSREKSIEPNIAELGNGWLKAYGLDYKLEQESLNYEIDRALMDYHSKSGGNGVNRPDTKLLLQDENFKYYPILIEYKGYKDKLVKLDNEGGVENLKKDNSLNYTNIKNFAVNGAVHYANALLHHTSYTDVVAVGVTGYKDIKGDIHHEIGVYFVSKENYGYGQKIGEYSDFSFLSKENFNDFIQSARTANIGPAGLARIREKKEQEIETSLMRLNNDIYQNEKGLSEQDRVHLVAASIIATIGVQGIVRPLVKEDLVSSMERGLTDGEIIMKKVDNFLYEKKLPADKKDLVIRALQNTLLAENLNRVENGETQLKRVFIKIVDDLGYYYKIGLTTDFTGKLFNEMYSWLGFTQDKLNDVVLTPFYVAELLVKLARVNRDSYVWDFATGSAGLLVAAMNEMLDDAKEHINSPEELAQKQASIKANQLLGLEILPSIYMLAVLNMILMGDGSSNILNKDSIKGFDGDLRKNEKFLATALVLNPPYSAAGNGMVFVESALKMMLKGYASVIIQSSTGSGKAIEINKRILQGNTLLASIEMPSDIFKTSVKTHIYVFRVGEKHEKDSIVKFIDFSNDGYTRSRRKRARASLNLQDTDNAAGRYSELVELVKFGQSKLRIFSSKEYFESTIDPQSGKDWNQKPPVDTRPTLEDFKKTVADYLAWEVSNILKGHGENAEQTKKFNALLEKELSDIKWGEFRLGDILLFSSIKQAKSQRDIPTDDSVKGIHYIVQSTQNNMLSRNVSKQYLVDNNEAPVSGNKLVLGVTLPAVSYQPREFGASQVIIATAEWLNAKNGVYVATAISKLMYQFSYAHKPGLQIYKNLKVKLPSKDGKPDFKAMERFIGLLEAERIRELEAYLFRELEVYLSATGINDTKLTQEERQALDIFNDYQNGRNALVWEEFKFGDLFEIKKTLNFNKNRLNHGNTYDYVTRTSQNQGILQSTGFVNQENINPAGTWSLGLLQMDFFYREKPWYAGQFVRKIAPKIKLTKRSVKYFSTVLNKQKNILLQGLVRDVDKLFSNAKVFLPSRDGQPDFDFMDNFISAIQKLVIEDVVVYAEQKIRITRDLVNQ